MPAADDSQVAPLILCFTEAIKFLACEPNRLRGAMQSVEATERRSRR